MNNAVFHLKTGKKCSVDSAQVMRTLVRNYWYPRFSPKLLKFLQWRSSLQSCSTGSHWTSSNSANLVQNRKNYWMSPCAKCQSQQRIDLDVETCWFLTQVLIFTWLWKSMKQMQTISSDQRTDIDTFYYFVSFFVSITWINDMLKSLVHT